jgi:hypothetical protein
MHMHFRSTLVSLAISGLLTLLGAAVAFAGDGLPPFPR